MTQKPYVYGQPVKVQVHRFRDGVALCLIGSPPTRYLAPDAARKLALALLAAVHDCEKRKAHESLCATEVIESPEF